MSTTIAGVVAAYLLATIAIGVWATRKTKNAGDFFVAGRNLGMLVVALAVFTSIQSGFGVLGGTGLTFESGLGGFVAAIGFAAPLGFVLAWFLVAKRMWRIANLGEVYTLGDVVEHRYGSPGVRGWVGVAVALGVIGYLGVQVQATGFIMSAIFDIEFRTAAVIGLVILGIYAIGGGTIAAVYTDLFQGIILVGVSAAVVFIAINAGGGVQNITENLQSSDPALASPFGTVPTLTIACYLFLFGIGAAGQPQLLTKFLMIRDSKELRWGALVSAVAYLLTMLLVAGVGLTALSLNVQGEFPALDSPDQALTRFFVDFTPPLLAGLGLAAILAAIMSTGDAFLNLGAASLIRDIPRSLNFRIRNELLWSRLVVAVLLVVSLLFSFYLDTLVALLGVFGWGTFAAALFPAVVLGLVWPRATKHGAIWSIIASLVANFVLEIGGLYDFAPLPEGVVNGAFALVVAIVVFIAVSLVTQPAEDETSPEVRKAMES
ncbi:MAG: sodium/proline symporter [Rubrobacter sp.]|nr:sodium/proline symporter [Rubrobacter sp.]